MSTWMRNRWYVAAWDSAVDRWQICHFVAPVAAGATVEDHDQGVRGFVFASMTPEAETSCHYFWGMARNFDIGDVGFTARLKKQQSGVFAENVEILEAQQRSIPATSVMKPRVYAIEGGGVRSRPVIDRVIANQAYQAAA